MVTLQEFRDGNLDCECVHMQTYGLSGLSKIFLTLSIMFYFLTRGIYSVLHVYLKIKNERMKRKLSTL